MSEIKRHTLSIINDSMIIRTVISFFSVPWIIFNDNSTRLE
ncbi:hypothetical protein ECDEC15C_3025 [Escherichia coli DEC15C]|nr:hypothetical protein ECDEC15C_3025 [Escherichia coli DEC15C]